jgi:hypothetical protein
MFLCTLKYNSESVIRARFYEMFYRLIAPCPCSFVTMLLPRFSSYFSTFIKICSLSEYNDFICQVSHHTVLSIWYTLLCTGMNNRKSYK